MRNIPPFAPIFWNISHNLPEKQTACLCSLCEWVACCSIDISILAECCWRCTIFLPAEFAVTRLRCVTLRFRCRRMADLLCYSTTVATVVSGPRLPTQTSHPFGEGRFYWCACVRALACVCVRARGLGDGHLSMTSREFEIFLPPPPFHVTIRYTA